MSEIREIAPPHTGLAFEAMRALRPALSDPDAFARQVDTAQRPEGYRLIGAFSPERGQADAVAGFRIQHNLVSGRHLYVDDLSTLPTARRRGHALALLDWLGAEARREGCTSLELDSGVGPERMDAHRLYFNAGLRIASYHFGRGVS